MDVVDVLLPASDNEAQIKQTKGNQLFFKLLRYWKCLPLDGPPDNDYFGQVVYERPKDNEWLTRFIVAKHLNVLTEVNVLHPYNILNIPYI